MNMQFGADNPGLGKRVLPPSRHGGLALPGLAFLVALCLHLGALASPAKTEVKEYLREFTTYPYGDPDPVPTMSRFYPYFRYDGFTDVPSPRKWKVVELSNEYLQVLILPEIGGKVWAAIEKSTGRPFIYFNHVVKFRDVSMRGPWTSGGMEANYGIMGHTPNCFSPVDYVTRRNSDGSASCIIGTLDLLTRSVWRLEIKLAPGEAGFTTSSLWHNSSGMEQPYYTWMNVGIKSAGNLEFANPGTRYLGHEGKAFPWPTNTANGHAISWYDRNDFGSYKSYHVFGRFAEFFGGYWHDDDFGMARSSPYGDKPGRKVWIWGLSGEGMIWEKLLTDTDGQYVEVQSGRLFNQSADESTFTPFKHKEFPPYATDVWTEHWQPVKGTKGIAAASPWGAMNVSPEADKLVVRISPTRAFHGPLEIFDGSRRLAVCEVDLKPMRLFEQTFVLAGAPGALRVSLGGGKLEHTAGDADVLSRPTEAPADFDWHSTYGLYLKGKESSRERAYAAAAQELEACLKTDPNFVPALVEMAALANRRGHAESARDFALHALRVDTYDPGANYQLGLASVSLGRATDAREAFSIAALVPGWRAAASVELAKAWLREGNYSRAWACAETALDSDRRNLNALQLQAVLCRLEAQSKAEPPSCRIAGLSPKESARKLQDTLLDLDPLNHLARCERLLSGTGSAAAFTNAIRNELPHETFLELAAWYRGVGLAPDAARVLALAPGTAEVLYWRAFLGHDAALLARAEQASPAFVFPFRLESIPVFDWARATSRAWQARYYLALVRWHLGDLDQARELFAACGDEPTFAPFYAARAQLIEARATRDLARAAQLDPGQWRYGAAIVKRLLGSGNVLSGMMEKGEFSYATLIKRMLSGGDAVPALAAAEEFSARFPTNTTLAVLHAKALVHAEGRSKYDKVQAGAGRYREALDLLTSLRLLPSEGSTDARALYHEACLKLAVERMRQGAFRFALDLLNRAREWPETLGSGKPYPEDVDERLEDWLTAECWRSLGDAARSAESVQKILAWSAASPGSRGAGAVVQALALRKAGRAGEAEQFLHAWAARGSGNPLAKWGIEILAHPDAPLPAEVSDPASQALAEWLKSSTVVK